MGKALFHPFSALIQISIVYGSQYGIHISVLYIGLNLDLKTHESLSHSDLNWHEMGSGLEIGTAKEVPS